jgi:hypothetical protein
MITDEQYGALKRIVEEIKEKRAAKCLFIDCVVNQRIGGNDIELAESFLKSLEDRYDRKLRTKPLAEQQKQLEDILSFLGYKPEDEYESDGVVFTKYEKVGIGVRIERNL